MGDDYSSKNTSTITFPPTGYQYTYDYKHTNESNGKSIHDAEVIPQPHTTPIAHFTSQQSNEFYQLIDVSPHFIVYAVKNNLVRVIDRASANRTLLRGHSSPVTCIKFFHSRKPPPNVLHAWSDVLATVGGRSLKPDEAQTQEEKTIFVWRVFCTKANPELVAEKLLEIQYSTAHMITWHPHNPNQFLISATDANSVFIETTRLVTQPCPESGHAICSCANGTKDLGNALDIFSGDVPIDVDWNRYHDNFVLTAMKSSNEVQLWNLVGWGGPMTTTRDVKREATLAVENISSCFFVNHNKGTFVTGLNQNSSIILWSTCFKGKIPTKLQIWRFSDDTQIPLAFNIAVTEGNQTKDSNYLLLSDRNAGNLFALQISQDRFISFSPFSVLHPIFSWSVMSTPSTATEKPYDENDYDIACFCVQSKAVQMLILKNTMLTPDKTHGATVPIHIDIQTEGEILSKPNHKFDNIEDYEDDQEIDYDYEEEDDQEEQTEKEEFQAPPAASLPPPSAASFDNQLSASGGNSFSNWLGSLAASSELKVPTSSNEPKNNETAPTPPPPPPPPPTTMNILQKPSTISDEALLSPTDFLKAEVVTLNTLSDNKPSLPSLLDVSEAEDMQQKTQTTPSMKPRSSSSGRSNNGKHDKNNTKSKASVSSTTPAKKSKSHYPQQQNSPPKITTILKREDAKPSAQEATSTAIPVNNNGIEEMTKKLFKKQEAFIQAEMQRVIHSEIQTLLIPSLTKSLTQSMEQSITKPLQNTIQKESNDETKIKELSQGLVDGIKPPIIEAFHQSMREVMIPAYEAATKEMFHQVSTCLEKNIDSYKGETSEIATNSMNTLSKKMDSMAIALESLSVEVTHLRTLVTTLSENNASLSSTLPKDTSKAQSIAAAKDEIKNLLLKQEYEAAFTKALSVSSAEVVVYSCKSASSQILFESGESSPLSQPILLCLMQQLGSVIPTANTSDLLEILPWLQDICVVLDPKNKSIQGHVGGVLQQLVTNINIKASEGDLTFRRPLQMLLQVIRGIGVV